MSEGPAPVLGTNVMHFCRVLRAAGLPVGPGAVIDALAALGAIDVGRRSDFRAALCAVLVKRAEHLELFAQAFDAFFRDPLGPEQALAALLPTSTVPPAADARALSRRVAEALAPPRPHQLPGRREVEVDASLTASAREVLAKKDFAHMSAEELARARAAVAHLAAVDLPLRTRRFEPAAHSPRVDLKATVRASARTTGRDIALRFRAPRVVVPPVVVLCDISGSMARYTEVLLHFIHALAARRRRVAVFLFGTRLTNITRALRFKDIDVALARVSAEALDFAGGTRIATCLGEFHRRWARRVLGQGARVLLITDGLERESSPQLEVIADRIQRSCRRLIWLNPLLGFEGFEPRAAGIRALLPHVDEFRPVHNLESLAQLALALGGRELDSPSLTSAQRHHHQVRVLRR